MKTLATAVAFLALTATAWAEEPEQAQFELLKDADEPFVLSELQLDGVTAGGTSSTKLILFGNPNIGTQVTVSGGSTSSQSRWYKFSVEPN